MEKKKLFLWKQVRSVVDDDDDNDNSNDHDDINADNDIDDSDADDFEDLQLFHRWDLGRRRLPA